MNFTFSRQPMTEAQYDYIVNLMKKADWNWQRCFEWLTVEYSRMFKKSDDISKKEASALIEYLKELGR